MRNKNLKHPDSLRNSHWLVGLAVVALVATSCGSLETADTVGTSAALSGCGAETTVDSLNRDRNDGDGSSTHLILHVAPGHTSHGAIADTVESAAERGHALTAWRIQSSNAAELQRLGEWHLAGTSRNKSNLRTEVAGLAADATCELLDLIEVPGDGDKGADLTGALSQVMRKPRLADPDGVAHIVLLSEGAVHRTNQLDLGNPDTGPEAWETTATELAKVSTRAGESSSLKVAIHGIEDAREAISDKVVQNIWQFWDDVCKTIEQGGAQCSTHS